MIFVCLVKVDDGIYLLTGDEGHILGGPDKQFLLDYWTKGWESGLARGGGFSAGAMLSFIQFRPSIVQVEDLEALKGVIGHDGPYEYHSVGGMGGWFYGIQCNSDLADTLWNGGEQPEFFRRV